MRRLAGRGLAAVALAGAAVAAVPGVALAIDSQTYVYDCGGSRGATLTVFVAGPDTGRYEVVGEGQSGTLEPNRPYSISVPAGQGQVLVGANGTSTIDKTSGVTCDTAP